MKRIALVDCNNFFVSCERVFNPELRNRPVIVLSSNDGCAVARSNEAKALGIPMGAPLFKIKEIVQKNSVAVFSSNFELYADMSHRVMTTLEEFCPEVEVYSVDEAFLDLTSLSDRDFTDYCKEIRETVYRNTGIPVSIGIASSKTLAKIASKVAKRDATFGGVLDMTNLPKEKVNEILAQTPVGDVWGVGRRTSVKLCDRGICNALQLANTDEKTVRRFMTVMGERVVLELRGIHCYDVDNNPHDKESMAYTRSFAKPIEDYDSLECVVVEFVTGICKKLRSQKSIAQNIAVYIRTDRFGKSNKNQQDANRTNSFGYWPSVLPDDYYSNYKVAALPYPSAITSDFVKAAKSALKKIFIKGKKYKKAGVFLGEISSKSYEQFSLTDDRTPGKIEKNEKMINAIDMINKRFCKDVLKVGSADFCNRRVGRRERLSPGYTTSWSEILRVS